MNVLELLELANWFNSNYSDLSKKYLAVQRVLQNNVNQGAQQPLEEPLNDLIEFLASMRLGELNIQQLRFLDQQGVANLIGHDGVEFVKRTVMTTTYDPATSLTEIQDASSKIGKANQKLVQYQGAVDELGIRPETFGSAEDEIVVRVGFRNEASIEHIEGWRTSANDWYHIIRGLSMLVGESPENTRVIGASNGSIILILATTATVSGLLAMISKHVTGIAKDVLSVQVAREELRSKRLLNDVMEAELTKQINEKREERLSAINKELAGMIPGKSKGDINTALEKSIDKLVEFGEKGGDVDFVAPPIPEKEENEDQEGFAEGAIDEKTLKELEEVRRLISDYQEERETVKLLEDNSSEQNE